MRTVLFWSLVMMTSVCLAAQASAQREITIWPDHRDADIGGKGEEMIARKPDGTSRWVTKVAIPTMILFLPKDDATSHAAVIICPGGGYGGESYDEEGTEVAQFLTTHGVAGVVLKYRLPEAPAVGDEMPVPQQDVLRAVRLVRSRASEFGVDPGRIGVMGFSAGGHLAATAGTLWDKGNPSAADPIEKVSSRPDFLGLIYPVITFEAGVTHGGTRQNLIGEKPAPAQVFRFSAELNVTPETPPTFLMHCTDDKTVPVENSLRFYRAAAQAGVPVEMHIFEKGGHGFGMRTENVGLATTWRDRYADWMRARGIVR